MVDGDRLATPSGVTEVLEAYGMATRKSLGQNFLVDRPALARIVEAAELHPEDVVLEIGPGLGVLTRELAMGCRRVVAVEVDEGFVRWLHDLFATEPAGEKVRIVAGDALAVDLRALLEEHPPGPGGAYKAVANLPYYITSPLLMRLLEERLPLRTAVIMVQKEVARRLSAAPGTKDYGALSVAVQLRAETETVATVPPGAFYPPPAVQSAVVRLRLKPVDESIADWQLLRDAIRTAFGQRRKTVRNAWRHAASLRDVDDPTGSGGASSVAGTARDAARALDEALQAAGIDGRRRGETLTPAEFVRAADEFSRRGIFFSPS